MDEDQNQAGAQLNGAEQVAAAVEAAQDNAAALAAENDAAAQKRTPEQVRAEIEQTREQLGDTAEALAAKTDVKGQAKRAVDNAKTTVADTVTGARQAASEKKDGFISGAQLATPQSAGDAGQRASVLVRKNRAVVIPVVALVLGILIGRRRSR